MMKPKVSEKDEAARVSTATLYGLMAQSKTYPDRIELGRGDPDQDTPRTSLQPSSKLWIKHRVRIIR